MFAVPLAVVLSTLALGTPANADDGNSTTTPIPTPCAHPVDLARSAYALNRWRYGPDADQFAAARSALGCTDSPAQALEAIRRFRGRFRMYVDYRHIAPFRCQRGMFGYWSIPCAIIACESHFDWLARNASGAVGPYELLGWGARYPARSFADELQNHRIAARVYDAGNGRSNWVC